MYESTWAELRELIQEKAKASQAESKRLQLLSGYVDVRDLMGVLTGLLEAVKANVSDWKARQAIQTWFNQLMGVHTQTAAMPAVEVIEHER